MMSICRVVERLALVVAVVAVTGCSGGTDCDAVGCANPVTMTASLPAIGTATWTVSVCLNGECWSGELTAAEPSTYAVGTDMSVADDAGGSRLSLLARTGNPKDGDVWSVSVVDDQGMTLLGDSRTVSYQSYDLNDCTVCKKATIEF